MSRTQWAIAGILVASYAVVMVARLVLAPEAIAEASPGAIAVSEIGELPTTTEGELSLAPYRELLPHRSTGVLHEGHWRGKPALADLDGDGHLDLIASMRRLDRTEAAFNGLYVWLGDGKGGWSRATEGITPSMGYGGVEAGDLDADGDLDLVFAAHNRLPQVFLNDGAARWQVLDEMAIQMPGLAADVAVGNWTGDSGLEIAAVGFFSGLGGLWTFRFDAGSGEWWLDDGLLPEDHFGAQVIARDIDADGWDDLAATTSLGPRVWLRTEEGLQDVSEALPTPEVGGSDLGVDLADLDGDGFLELLVSGMVYEGHAPLVIYRWSGAAWEPWGEGLPDDQVFFDVTFAELDGREGLEIVAAGKKGIVLIGRTGPERFEPYGILPDTDGVLNIAAGDVDHDGRDEILSVGFLGVEVLDVQEALEGIL